LRIGVLASHAGTTLQSVIDAVESGRLAARLAIVISNNSGSGALSRARRAGIPAVHLSSATHQRPELLDAAVHDALVDAGADVVFLLGYMKQLGPRVLDTFRGRVLNTHPALLPKFGGLGMYGDRVHAAVLQAGDTQSGVSIHQVDPEYDSGAVVRQRTVPVLPGDSVETLKARVQAAEKTLVVETLAAIAAGQIPGFRAASTPR